MRAQLSPRSTRCAAQAQRGLALIEFALMLPVMVLLVFGAITFTVALYDKSVLTHASRQAVRAWVVSKPALSKDAVQQMAASLCQSQLISFGGGSVSCVPVAIGPDSPISGDVLTVSVTMSYTGLYLFKNLRSSAQTSMKFE